MVEGDKCERSRFAESLILLLVGGYVRKCAGGMCSAHASRPRNGMWDGWTAARSERAWGSENGYSGVAIVHLTPQVRS